jgi:hypothetical protein
MSELRGNPKRVDALVINADKEASSLLDPTTGKILITNLVGRRIIELSDGSRDVGSIARQLGREFAGPGEDQLAEHVGTFLAAGEKKGIITWTASSQAQQE